MHPNSTNTDSSASCSEHKGETPKTKKKTKHHVSQKKHRKHSHNSHRILNSSSTTVNTSTTITTTATNHEKKQPSTQTNFMLVRKANKELMGLRAQLKDIKKEGMIFHTSSFQVPETLIMV
uniref:Uncharacterized protein n=1 Tax=Octopus bimaculoides TaxID=37653 RepID=A0A0L8G3T1_OCTBM